MKMIVCVITLQEEEKQHSSRKHGMNGSVTSKNTRESHGYDYELFESYSAFSDKAKKPSSHLCDRSKAKRHASSEMEQRPLTYPRTPHCRARTVCLDLIDPDCIDDYARLFFPIMFILFNVTYWLKFVVL